MEYPGGGNLRLIKKDNQGSITVWIVMVFPVLAILFCLLVNTFLLVDAKIRMQTAIDRGVLAGADHLSTIMNEAASLNWQFRKEYLDKKEAFGSFSEDNAGWIRDQIKELNFNQSALAGQIDELLERGYREAHDIARQVVGGEIQRVPLVDYKDYDVLYGGPAGKMFNYIDDCPGAGGDCLNKRRIVPYEIVGTSYDPEKYKSYIFDVYEYRIKSGDFVALAAGVKTVFRPPLLGRFFAGDDEVVWLDAAAAAQPYGGSIKEFAFIDAEDLDGAKNSSGDLNYRAALIPLRAVIGGLDVYH